MHNFDLEGLVLCLTWGLAFNNSNVGKFSEAVVINPKSVRHQRRLIRPLQALSLIYFSSSAIKNLAKSIKFFNFSKSKGQKRGNILSLRPVRL